MQKRILYKALMLLALAGAVLGTGSAHAAVDELPAASSGPASAARVLQQHAANAPPHKPLLPIRTYDIGVFVVAAIVLFIAAGAGMGGGPVLVPIYLSLGQFSQSAAVALSNSTILAGSCANVLCNGRKRHPFKNKSLVDWDLILLMEPPTLLGAIAGSYINKLLPVVVSHILLALLLTLMTARVMQRARLIYSRETAARSAAAQANSAAAAEVATGPAAATAAAAAPAEVPARAVTESRACCVASGSSSSSASAGGSRSAGSSFGGADAVVQLSAVAKASMALAGSEDSNSINNSNSSCCSVNRRPARGAGLGGGPAANNTTMPQQPDGDAILRSAAPAAPAAGTASPAAAAVGAGAARLPSSTLLPLEIEGNISETALAQLVGTPASAPALLQLLQPPARSAAAAAGASSHPGEALFAGVGQQVVLVPGQQQQQQGEEGVAPSEAECKLLYAPPGHTRRESWEAFDDDWEEEAGTEPSAASLADNGRSLTGLSVASGLSVSQRHLLAGRSGPSSTAAVAIPSRFAAAAAAAGVATFGTPPAAGGLAAASNGSDTNNSSSSSFYQYSALARNSTAGGAAAGVAAGASSAGGSATDPTLHLLTTNTNSTAAAAAAAATPPAVSPRLGRCSKRPPEIASAAAAVAVEPVLRAESAQFPLLPLALLSVLFVAVLLTSLLSKAAAGCGSLAYWLVQWSVAPVLFAVWWFSRRHVLAKVALKRAALVDFHGEVRWTSRNSIVFPAICSMAGVIAGMFGLGGAVVKTPLMLELGVHPQVTAATTQTMLLLTSAASTIVYAQLGDIPWDYAAVILPLAFCVTLAGQFAIDWLVHKVGRSSLVVLVLAGFFSVACLLTYYITGLSLAHLIRQPQGALAPGKICA